jgi:hypothetical protein
VRWRGMSRIRLGCCWVWLLGVCFFVLLCIYSFFYFSLRFTFLGLVVSCIHVASLVIRWRLFGVLLGVEEVSVMRQ